MVLDVPVQALKDEEGGLSIPYEGQGEQGHQN